MLQCGIFTLTAEETTHVHWVFVAIVNHFTVVAMQIYLNTADTKTYSRHHSVAWRSANSEAFPLLYSRQDCARGCTIQRSDYDMGSVAAYSDQWLGYSLPTIQVLILNKGNTLHPPPKISPLDMRSTQPMKCVPRFTCLKVKLLRRKYTICIHLAPRLIYAAILIIPLHAYRAAAQTELRWQDITPGIAG
jgi:hypothetical protein